MSLLERIFGKRWMTELFSPQQPRAPAGTPTGGEWVSAAGRLAGAGASGGNAQAVALAATRASRRDGLGSQRVRAGTRNSITWQSVTMDHSALEVLEGAPFGATQHFAGYAGKHRVSGEVHESAGADRFTALLRREGKLATSAQYHSRALSDIYRQIDEQLAKWAKE
jgi:hypothetical protein